jgi:hypothetical protein
LIAAGLFKTEGLMSSGSVTILIWNSILMVRELN